jgi:hypothetical protein
MGTKVKNRIKKTLKDLTEEDKFTIGIKADIGTHTTTKE